MKQSDIIITYAIIGYYHKNRLLVVAFSFAMLYRILNEGKYDIYIPDLSHLESTIRAITFKMQKCFEYFLGFFRHIYFLIKFINTSVNKN